MDDDTIVMTQEEKDEVKYLSIFDNNEDDFDEQVMSVENVDALKKYEQAMTERTDKGYYRCKVKHEKLYNEFMLCYKKYITPDMLRMLMHNFSTQKNESLNHSVATGAPKGKDYSQSPSLQTRVMLTGTAQIVGHYQLWKRLFSKFNLELDPNLIHHLKRKDIMKEKKKIEQNTKKYKAKRSSNRYAKFAEAHRSQLDEVKTGAMYESGIAVQLAKKSIKSAPKRNPEGTLRCDLICAYYHPKFCTVKGHSDCRSVQCYFKGKPKEERDAALAFIRNEAITKQVEDNASKGM